MNELKLLRSIYGAPKASVTPKLFHGANLLLTPLAGLTEACRMLADGNMFISFAPPRNFSERIENAAEFYENIPALPSMDESLYPQVCGCPGYAGVRQRAPAGFWCSLLGPEGYLNCTPDQAAELSGLGLRETLAFIENLKNHVEPPGLFASGLAESLTIQLRRAGLEGSAAWFLITEGRDALADEKLAEWRVSRGVGESVVDEAMRVLRALDPAPGRNFSQPRYIAADVEFSVCGGEVEPRLITGNLPSLEAHFAEFGLARGEAPSERWMRGEWSVARRALKLLGLRCRTVMRLSLYIASKQREKILDMSLPPKPMTYAEAGAALSLHASTLHRCAKNTYCMINGRCFQMSAFFSRASAADRKMSVSELRARVAELRAAGMTNRAIGKLLGVPERTAAYHALKSGTSRRR
ncbi:hypothetical protein B5F39_12755 [Cloacibacillus sp. An23]|nr:hypothetical protein B5F39_12755 [Cloacibacillus sp. An23]